MPGWIGVWGSIRAETKEPGLVSHALSYTGSRVVKSPSNSHNHADFSLARGRRESPSFFLAALVYLLPAGTFGGRDVFPSNSLPTLQPAHDGSRGI
jgi:hypothetical protein